MVLSPCQSQAPTRSQPPRGQTKVVLFELWATDWRDCSGTPCQELVQLSMFCRPDGKIRMRGCRLRSHQRGLWSQGRQTLASQIQRVVAAPATKKDAQIEGEQMKEVNEEKPTIEFDDAGEGDSATRGRRMTQ